MSAPTPSSVIPYLRSCKQECDKPISGEVKGEVPKWLKGCLIRVGCGLLEIGPDKYKHVFDGMALMHRFSFSDGNVTYQNKFLRSDAYRRNMKANRIVMSEFATRGIPDPCKTIFQRFQSYFSLDDLTDNDMVNIVLYGDEVYACTESNNIWRINPENLDALRKVNLRNYAPINLAIAHAHEDRDGTVYNVGSSLSSPSYSILKFPPKESKDSDPFKNASVVCRIPSSKSMHIAYHHSFAMTDNYFVFVEQPMFISAYKMMWSHFVSGTFADAMRWDENSQSRFHVVRRSDGKLLDTVYVSPSFFVFHHVNAYEEDNQLVLDMCCYPHGDVIWTLYVKALEDIVTKGTKISKPFVSSARRYVLPLNINKDSAKEEKNLVTLANSQATAHRQPNGSILLEPEVLTGSEPWAPELPRINYEKCNGKKYKYFYAIAGNDKKRNHLIKVDTTNQTTLAWGEEGAVPSEPVFMADPNASGQEEDSGVLLASLLYRDNECKVSMLVLNAKTMTEIARVTFIAPSSIPGDFHGTFIAK